MEKRNLQFTSIDIGKIKEGKTVEVTSGTDFDIDSYGTMFSHHVEPGAGDEGRFVYTRVNGDFDFQVRVESIHNDSYNLTEACIMARKDLDPKSIFVCPSVTSNEFKGEAGLFTYIVRLKQGGTSYDSKHSFHGEEPYRNDHYYYGNEQYNSCSWGFAETRADLYPRTFPYVWLRLKKQGNLYAGYFKQNSVPGEGWTLLAQWEIDLGVEPYVGMNIIANHHSSDGKWDLEKMRRTRAQVKYRDLIIYN